MHTLLRLTYVWPSWCCTCLLKTRFASFMMCFPLGQNILRRWKGEGQFELISNKILCVKQGNGVWRSSPLIYDPQPKWAGLIWATWGKIIWYRGKSYWMVPIFMTSWNGTLQHTQDTFPLKIAEATFVVVFSISRISEHMYIVQLSTWMGWIFPNKWQDYIFYVAIYSRHICIVKAISTLFPYFKTNTASL